MLFYVRAACSAALSTRRTRNDTPTHPPRYCANSGHMPNIACMSAPLSAAQVAQAHGLAKRTVLLEIARGRLRAHKLPGRTGAWIITAEDAATWAATRNPSS